MAGRHEPGSSGSFYLSLATAALRVGLVIAAVVLGVFVLSKAFPTSDAEAPAPGPVTTASQPVPEETVPEPDQETQPADEGVELQGVQVQVQNGTAVTGLAAETAEQLKEQLGLRIPPRQIADAERTYDRTTLFFRQGDRAIAQAIRDQFFGGNAQLDRNPDNATEVAVVIVLGEDYAQGQGG